MNRFIFLLLFFACSFVFAHLQKKHCLAHSSRAFAQSTRSQGAGLWDTSYGTFFFFRVLTGLTFYFIIFIAKKMLTTVFLGLVLLVSATGWGVHTRLHDQSASPHSMTSFLKRISGVRLASFGK